jgi:hypothetical protein
VYQNSHIRLKRAATEEQKQQYQKDITELKQQTKDHQPDTEHKIYELYTRIKPLTQEATPSEMNMNIAFATKLKGYFIHLAIIRSSNDWKEHVIKELAKGGASLFTYINKEDKEFLNVDYTNTPGTDANPEIFLDIHVAAWKPRWCPSPLSQEHLNAAAHVRAFREISMGNPDLVKTNPQDLKDSIKSYPKETKGVDNFTKTDFKNLPDFQSPN